MTRLDPHVIAAQAGDTAAFETLVRKHQNLVCATTLAITRDLASSEDLAQQTFLTAWTRLGELRQAERFSGWIRQIARNLSLTHLRAQGRRIQHEAIPPAPAPQADPEEAFARAEDALLIHQALSALQDDDREVLTLVYRDELATKEVAELLGLSQAAVRKRVQRGRHALKTAVDDQLRQTLRRTRPAVAFTAAVMALLASAPAHADVRRTPRWPLPLAGLVLVTSTLLLAWRNQTPDPSTPARGQTAVGSTQPNLNPEPAEVPLPPPEALGTLEPVTVRMLMAGIQYTFPSARNTMNSGPVRWFPDRDDTRLPALQTTAEIHRLQAVQRKQSSAGSLDTLIALAELEEVHLDTDSEDPWFQLLAFEVERRVGGETSAQEAELIDLAEERIEANPGSEVADIYRLYLTHFNSDRGTAATVELLASESSWNRSNALDALGRLPVLPELSDAEMKLATSALSDLEEEDLRRGYRTLMGLAARKGDWDTAERFAADHRRVVEAECPHWPLTPTGGMDFCHFWTSDVERYEGQIAAFRGEKPNEWRPALVAALWTCFEEHGWTDRGITLKTLAAGGQWRWDAWPTEAPFTSCVDTARPTLPMPPDGQPVHLNLTGVSPPP